MVFCIRKNYFCKGFPHRFSNRSENFGKLWLSCRASNVLKKQQEKKCFKTVFCTWNDSSYIFPKNFSDLRKTPKNTHKLAKYQVFRKSV